MPDGIPEGALDEAQLGELWHQICVEVMDEKYAGRMHGNRRTYDAGCQGPACKKASREHGRRRTQVATPSAKYQYVDLIVAAWFPVATDRVAKARQRLLEEIAPAS
jgi:hypothetical protein